jgi:hypothetical protein
MLGALHCVRQDTSGSPTSDYCHPTNLHEVPAGIGIYGKKSGVQFSSLSPITKPDITVIKTNVKNAVETAPETSYMIHEVHIGQCTIISITVL